MKQELGIIFCINVYDKGTRCAIFRNDALCGTWKEKLL